MKCDLLTEAGADEAGPVHVNRLSDGRILGSLRIAGTFGGATVRLKSHDGAAWYTDKEWTAQPFEVLQVDINAARIQMETEGGDGTTSVTASLLTDNATLTVEA